MTRFPGCQNLTHVGTRERSFTVGCVKFCNFAFQKLTDVSEALVTCEPVCCPVQGAVGNRTLPWWGYEISFKLIKREKYQAVLRSRKSKNFGVYFESGAAISKMDLSAPLPHLKLRTIVSASQRLMSHWKRSDTPMQGRRSPFQDSV
jgi:hypothetical protein